MGSYLARRPLLYNTEESTHRAKHLNQRSAADRPFFDEMGYTLTASTSKRSRSIFARNYSITSDGNSVCKREPVKVAADTVNGT